MHTTNLTSTSVSLGVSIVYLTTVRLSIEKSFSCKVCDYAQEREMIFVFFDIYKDLCTMHGLTPNGAAKILGLSSAIVTKWKQTGATPRYETLSKIADYFNVSIDYLTGNGDVPADQFLAFYGSVKEDLTEDDLDDIRVAMKAKAERNKRRKSGE